MAISVADNFSYQGNKPLDARIVFNTIAEMKSKSPSILYDGCLGYVKANKKYYTYDSTNTEDATLGKWSELSTGSSVEVDNVIDNTSENPVQNKIIADVLDDKLEADDFVEITASEVDALWLSV